MTTHLRLHYAPDNASLCVRLALEALDLPYTTALVDRQIRAQTSAAYRALNPNGQIPALETPHGPMFETGAILLWLADQVPGRIFPKAESHDRPMALSWLFWLSNTVHPALRTSFYPEKYSRDPAEARSSAQARLSEHFDLLNTHWAALDGHTLLGCYLAPMLRWSALYGGDTQWFDLSHWAQLQTFATLFENLSFVQRSAAAEGLGPTPFSDPTLPNPPEGTAL